MNDSERIPDYWSNFSFFCATFLSFAGNRPSRTIVRLLFRPTQKMSNMSLKRLICDRFLWKSLEIQPNKFFYVWLIRFHFTTFVSTLMCDPSIIVPAICDQADCSAVSEMRNFFCEQSCRLRLSAITSLWARLCQHNAENRSTMSTNVRYWAVYGCQ